MPQPPQIAPPAATGNAGPQFEATVGAFYLLSLLSGSEPRGLPGATIRTVEFQRRGSGHPLDDVIIQAVNADGSAAVLEIQAKRTLKFTASDAEFRDVVAQMWEATQKPEYPTIRYELAVAIARTSTRVEHACQEVLQWARQLPDALSFAEHIERERFASNDMRDFVKVFRANLALAGGPTDYETVWRLLRSFQILAFDFESPGSDYEHRARERARLVLIPDQVERAAALWPVLIHHAGVCARAGGALDRPALVTPLEKQYEFLFDQRADLRAVNNRLADAAKRALDEIPDEVGGVKLARTELIDQAVAALDQQPVLHIVGAPGCGKSWVMKHLARLIQPEGRIIVLRNGRVIPGGWLPMAHTIGCAISQEEFFNELGCGGGVILFIDNIDQINDAGDWATVQDLMGGVIESPGWRAVVTGGLGNDEWKTKLTGVKRTDITTLEVGSVTDDEVKALSESNQALAVVLNENHPAKGIARNLFYLSRLVELSNGDTELAAGIATEIDLAWLWWRYGGGRAEDDGRLARLKLLRTIGAQTIHNPGRSTYLIDDLDSTVVANLLRFDSLQEDIKGATVSFRHDVLRDWTVGFLLHERKDLINALPFDQALPVGLGRGLEIAARLALEADAEGRAWLELLSLAEREGGHGSWKRPILLALIRSEDALPLMMRLKSVLLEAGGRRLSEIIRLMIAVESQPLAKAISRLRPSFPIPPGVDDLIIPKGAGWTWLVIWLVTEVAELPTELIPDVARVFQAWLIATQNQPLSLNSKIVGILFEWLALIEDRMAPRTFRRIEDAPPLLNFPHMREVRDRIQMAVFAFARQNPAAAAGYLSAVTPDTVRHDDQQAILRAPGSLSVAAPKELVDFILRTIIEKDDPKDHYRSRHRYGPFGAHDHLYSRASPTQGPFLDLLENAPAEGLRLIRSVVEHATDWQREQYRKERQPFPTVNIPFPEGKQSFEGDWSVYYWARSIMPSTITASALMALEAWAHQQIEAGRPFAEVLHDVLGPDGSSIAFLAVAVDLVLSHFPLAYDVAWPMVATPEVLTFDNARHTRDMTGVDRMSTFDQAMDTGRVKRADLDAKPSRKVRLMDTFGQYVFRGQPEQLIALRTALEQALNEIKQKPTEDEDPINGVNATAERALRMTFAEHWPLVKIPLQDGSETEVHQYQTDSAQQQLTEERQTRANDNLHHLNVRLRVQAALFDDNKSTPEIVREGIEWAKKQPENDKHETGDDDDDFNKDWDYRAVVMAAALAVRDYVADDRTEVINWARSTLVAAAIRKGHKFRGNSQIEYSASAIAVLGLTSLYLQEHDAAVRDLVLRLASHQHEAVVRALGQKLTDFDERLARSIIRIIMTSSIHLHRTENEEEDEANKRRRQDRIENAIKVESQWLDGSVDEPAWPELPEWWLRRRRGIRLPGGRTVDDAEMKDVRPEAYVDEHALGTLASHLIKFTIGELPGWLLPLTAHLMDWTIKANGPHGEQGWQSDNRPTTWNHEFFDFAGVLAVALPHEQVSTLFIAPIATLGDEAFYDAAATFLRGYDRATIALDTKTPENPATIRTMLADRIRSTWNYKRYDDEKTFSMETHAGDAVTAMFYQPSPFMNHGHPTVPANWDGLDATIGVLTDLAVGAPTSGYIAVLYLNLIGASPRAGLLPYVVKAATAWCSGYGSDTNFWSERDIGHRLCSWLDDTVSNDPTAAARITEVRDDLSRCLDILIQSGVSQASEIEERIAKTSPDRKTA